MDKKDKEKLIEELKEKIKGKTACVYSYGDITRKAFLPPKYWSKNNNAKKNTKKLIEKVDNIIDLECELGKMFDDALEGNKQGIERHHFDAISTLAKFIKLGIIPKDKMEYYVKIIHNAKRYAEKVSEIKDEFKRWDIIGTKQYSEVIDKTFNPFTKLIIETVRKETSNKKLEEVI